MSNNKLIKLQEKINKLKERENDLKNRQKKKEREEKKQRLIQLGTIIENRFDIHTIKELEILIDILISDKEKFEDMKQIIKNKYTEFLKQETQKIKNESAISE